MSWDELIAAVPTLNSTEISCNVLQNGLFSIISGNLVAIQLYQQEYLDEESGK